MTVSVDRVYEFGEWRLDPAEHLLLRNGTAVPLGPKLFDTLLLLVENAGRLVTKEEFMRRVLRKTSPSCGRSSGMVWNRLSRLCRNVVIGF